MGFFSEAVHAYFTHFEHRGQVALYSAVSTVELHAIDDFVYSDTDGGHERACKGPLGLNQTRGCIIKVRGPVGASHVILNALFHSSITIL